MNKKKTNIKALAITAIMGALGAALMMVEFSIPIMPSFIKLDFSELPALITTFAFGPFWGILVCLIKNLIHLFFTTTLGVGELSNFILGAIFTGTAGLIYKRKKDRKSALLSCIISSLVMALVSVFTNYVFIYPMYYKFLHFPEQAILQMYQLILPSVDSIFNALLIFNLPFNFAKMLIVSIICFIIYKRISPVLKKQ